MKRRLFVGDEEDGRDVVRMLEAYKKAFSDEIKVFQLQKRVVGVEVAVGAFFNGKTFVYPVNTNFEHKKLFPGNIGPPTGEMGTTMFWSEPNKIFEQTLLKMARASPRRATSATSTSTASSTTTGSTRFEFTSRFGYPSIFIQQEGMITPIGLFLWDLAHGTDPKLKVKSGFQVGVRIVMPPFPFDDNETFESFSRNAVIVFKRGTPEEVHIEDTKIVEGQWLVAGTSGVVLTVVGLGQTMKQAREQAVPARPEHPDPQHVLPRRHRRALGRGLGQVTQLGISEVGTPYQNGIPQRKPEPTSPTVSPARRRRDRRHVDDVRHLDAALRDVDRPRHPEQNRPDRLGAGEPPDQLVGDVGAS